MHKGVDLSHHNQAVDFGTMKRSGVEFVGLKATEGTGFTDGTFADRRARARQVGFHRVLPYHFFHPALEAKAQAKRFAAVLGTLAPGEIPVIDLETTPGRDEWAALSPTRSLAVVEDFVYFAKVELGIKATDFVLYGSLGWLKGQFQEQLPELTFMRLWRAAYGLSESGDVSRLTPSTPWEGATIWQYSQYGTQAGAGAPRSVDLDLWIDGAAW